MAWSERDHPRDDLGRFTHSAVAEWASYMRPRFGGDALHLVPERPAGFDAARRRINQLGFIPQRRGRARTDDEQAEYDQLWDVMEGFREVSGLNREREADFTHFGDYRGAGRAPQPRRLKARTRAAKEGKVAGRIEDRTGTPKGRERLHADDGGKIGRRYFDTDTDLASVMMLHLRRAQARARVEGSARTPVRRTPRGTRVDSWMDTVNARMGRKG